MEPIDLRDYGTEFTADPYPLYAALRERGPVHRIVTPAGAEAWLVVGHDEARAVLTDTTMSKDVRALGVGWPELELFGPHMLTADPPQHTRLRRLVAREFTSRRVEALRPRVEQVTADLLDAMLAAPDGRADLVAALAFPLPITVICELLGVPDLDRESFGRWTDAILAPTDPESESQALHRMSGYLTTLLEEKRADPGDDLMSALLRTVDEDGDRLSPAELRGMAFLLLVAGHETTVNLLSNGIRALLTHPDQFAALRADPGLLDGAIEEMLRWDGPVETTTIRYTTEAVELGGVRIPAREMVLVALAAADRDPARFAAPDAFDIRRDARGHLAFGHGLHYCMGAPLARMEARIVLRALLERCPELALDTDPARLSWLPGLLIRGVRHLPVRFTPADAAGPERAAEGTAPGGRAVPPARAAEDAAQAARADGRAAARAAAVPAQGSAGAETGQEATRVPGPAAFRVPTSG
jgi:cytochrome P450